MGIAQVGLEPTASLVLSQGGLPIAYRAVSVIPDGLEPSLSGCRPEVVAAGPRDQSESGLIGNRTPCISFPLTGLGLQDRCLPVGP